MSAAPVHAEARTRWRWLPLAAAAGVWLALLAITLVPAWSAAARSRLPWMMEPLFHDWHIVRLGWEAHTAGVDPLADRGAPFNYPRFVLLAAPLRRVPPAIGALAGAAVFLAAIVWVLRPRTRGEALLAAALVVSPPVLLLLERGNLDAWAFALVAVGLGGLAGQRLAPAGGLATLLGAALIKFFPAALLPAAVLAVRGAARRWAVLTAGLFAIWLVLHFDDVALVMQKTTRGLVPAYGRMLAGARYHAEVVASAGHGPSQGALMHASLVLCVVVIAAAVVTGWLWRTRFRGIAATETERAFFWGGALVFSGTFALGSNWSYRLVFLALCVPFLWRARKAAAARKWATGCLLAVAVVMLAPFQLPLGIFLARQALEWGLVFATLSGAVALLSNGLGACRPTEAP